MDLDNLIINDFCIINDLMKELLKERRLRQRGPEPIMDDSEVITIEVIGEILGINTDKELFEYFRRYYSHFLPSLKKISRVTFIRQAANL